MFLSVRFTLKTFTVLSLDPETINLPSQLKSTDLTQALWLLIT